MSVCVYCGKRRACNEDHVIPRSVRKNRFRRTEVIEDIRGGGRRRTTKYATASGIVPEHLLRTEPACNECNTAKIARLLIPESWSEYLDELNALGIGTFRVWRGDAESLRMVVK